MISTSQSLRVVEAPRIWMLRYMPRWNCGQVEVSTCDAGLDNRAEQQLDRCLIGACRSSIGMCQKMNATRGSTTYPGAPDVAAILH